MVRIGALGDTLITTPLVRYLKSKGDEVCYLGSEQAEQILKHNTNIDKFIYHKRDSVENSKLQEYFEGIAKENKCDKIVDLCESIEVRLAVTSDYPQWNWSKKDRKEYCDRNYYEYTFEHAKINPDWENIADMKEFYKPEMFFDEEEYGFIEDVRKKLLGNKILMWGLSGSGRQKTYPYVPYIVEDLFREFKNLVVILVGGETCKILECGFHNHKRLMKKCGEFNFRQSALMSAYCDLVVSPDTGFLHASGCWETPKIGLLTHSTRENITKYFKNDYSLESESVCAPCFRLITDADTQCPLEKGTKACVCMSKEYMKPEKIFDRIKEVLNANRRA